MDITTIAIYFIGAMLALALIKFIIRLPFMLMSLAIIGVLGYAAYKFIWPMLKPMLNSMM